MNLPQSFIENMSEILGPELDEYLEIYGTESEHIQDFRGGI